MTIEEYQKIFKELGKEKFFNLNKSFLEEMISTENQIKKISNNELIHIHPNHPTNQKISESAKLLLKLKDTYTRMQVALNKILGNTDGFEEDPLKEFEGEIDE